MKLIHVPARSRKGRKCPCGTYHQHDDKYRKRNENGGETRNWITNHQLYIGVHSSPNCDMTRRFSVLECLLELGQGITLRQKSVRYPVTKTAHELKKTNWALVLTQVVPEATDVTPDRVPTGLASIVPFPGAAGFGLDSLVETAIITLFFSRALVLDDVMGVGFDVLIVGHNNLPTVPTLKADSSLDRRTWYIRGPLMYDQQV